MVALFIRLCGGHKQKKTAVMKGKPSMKMPHSVIFKNKTQLRLECMPVFNCKDFFLKSACTHIKFTVITDPYGLLL